MHIERDVLIGSGVHITSGSQTHGTADPSKPIREQEGQATMVRIGSGAWIGSAAVEAVGVGEGRARQEGEGGGEHGGSLPKELFRIRVDQHSEKGIVRV